MRIAVTGSIATDHLMSFPGRFTDQLIPDQLSTVSLSFLVDTLDIREGGVAANIAYGLASLGERPTLVGAVGADFHAYGERLRARGVDTESVHVSGSRHTARFVCTTDEQGNQLASFYPGAMSEASGIGLAPVADRLGGLDLVLIGANDPQAMLEHTRECRDRGYPFAADPSQQLASLGEDAVRELVTGADHLFTNAYEHALLLRRTGWTQEELLSRVGTWTTTLGKDGASVERAGQDPIRVAAVPVGTVTEPTGAGDAFRAGYLAAVGWGLPLETAAQLGCALASDALATTGPQGYTVVPGDLLVRLEKAYSPASAELLVPHMLQDA